MKYDELPRVTEVITSCILPETNYHPYYAERGTAVHKAIYYDNLGVLDEQSVNDLIAPYLEQYRRFVQDFQPKIVLAEARLVSPTYGFRGTPDIVALDEDGRLLVIDVKTGSKQAWHIVQMAAYLNLLEADDGLVGIGDEEYRPTKEVLSEKKIKLDAVGCAVANLYLAEDDYLFTTYNGPAATLELMQAWELFKAGLTIYNYRRQINGKK